MKSHSKKVGYILAGILIIIILYALKNTSYFVRVSSFLACVIVFYFADLFFNFRFKSYHYIIFILISAAGLLLSPLYFISTSYDKILHLISPFLMGVLIFFLVNRIKINFSTKLLITFSIVIMLLALFEIGEFLLDKLFDLKLQGVFLRDYSGIAKLNLVQDKNDDTMTDLIFGAISSLIFVGIKTMAFNYNKLKKKK